MIGTHNPEVGITDTRIEISTVEHSGVLVELSGEFDIHDLDALRKVLSVASSSAWSTYVDLSGVTFLDARCARELAVRSRFRDPLILRDPSWQAKASLKTCGLVREAFASSAEEPSRPAGARNRRRRNLAGAGAGRARV